MIVKFLSELCYEFLAEIRYILQHRIIHFRCKIITTITVSRVKDDVLFSVPIKYFQQQMCHILITPEQTLQYTPYFAYKSNFFSIKQCVCSRHNSLIRRHIYLGLKFSKTYPNSQTSSHFVQIHNPVTLHLTPISEH